MELFPKKPARGGSWAPKSPAGFPGQGAGSLGGGNGPSSMLACMPILPALSSLPQPWTLLRASGSLAGGHRFQKMLPRWRSQGGVWGTATGAELRTQAQENALPPQSCYLGSTQPVLMAPSLQPTPRQHPARPDGWAQQGGACTAETHLRTHLRPHQSAGRWGRAFRGGLHPAPGVPSFLGQGGVHPAPSPGAPQEGGGTLPAGRLLRRPQTPCLQPHPFRSPPETVHSGPSQRSEKQAASVVSMPPQGSG